MNRHQSPLALPAFNPCANSNDSDRSSSSNTTVTANAFSSPKRPDLSTVFANVAPDAPPRQTITGLKSNAFAGNGLSQFDAANGRLDASCWVQNGIAVSNGMNLNPSTQSLSSSNRSTPPQFLDEYGINGGGGGTAAAHSNMTSFPSFLHQQQPQYQSTDHQPPRQQLQQRQVEALNTAQSGSYRLINAFQDLNPYQQRQSEQNQQYHQLAVGINNGLNGVNYGATTSAVTNGVNLQSMQSALGAVSRFGGVNALNLCPPTESIPPSVGRLSFGMEALDRNQSALPSTTRSLQSFQNGVPRSISNSNGQRPNSSLMASTATTSANNRTSAVVVTAPPLPAAALPAALKRSPSPHGSGKGVIDRVNGVTMGKNKKCGSGSGGAMQKFECVDCGKRYKHLSNLRAHAKVHTAEAKVCPFCKKRFGRKANYEEHLRVHTGETPYECKYCQRKFKHRHSWKDHLRIHTGEKPYQCEICNRTFNVRHNLTVHYRVHTGERPYSCSICLKTFRQKSAVNSHVKRIHK